VGKNCKVILIGSSNQIDNLYINKYTNADSVIRGALKHKNEYINIFATKLNKVVRGNLTEFAEKLFTTGLK
jgi:PhoH-like ATPase